MTSLCAVCGHHESREVLSYLEYPIFLVPLELSLARNVEKAPIQLVSCLACGHFQVPRIDPNVRRLLYEVYYRHYEVDTLETMVPAYRDPFNRLVQSLADEDRMPHGHLLEIGCSSGAMIPFFTQYCERYTGVDPSERIELARAAHPSHEFFRSYFPSPDVQGPFDVAVTQFNLEHIDDAGAFMRELTGLVRQDGILLVQVPDAGYFLRTAQPNFMGHEHVQYFRRPQLQTLLARHGFEVERWGEQGASILCAARRATPIEGALFVEGHLAEEEVLRTRFTDTPVLPRGSVLYGAGLTLHWLLALDPDLSKHVTLVDDNPGYQGKGVPGYDLPIMQPTADLLAGRDVILTLNAIYHERVLERLRAMQTSMRVHRITAHGWTVEST